MTWKQLDPSQTPWNGDRATWITQLPDDLAIQDLSIPGTHDSASLKGFTHFAISETQQWKIEDQLQNGVRFFDLRVKIMFSHRGLAMYHGADAIYDPDQPHSYNQLYYKSVIQKCVKFLIDHPNEVIVISVKCEGDEKYDGWTVEDWFRQIANEVAADHPPGTWDRWWAYPSNVNATLHDLRGKMLLWRRFSRGGKDPSLQPYTAPFALDLTPLNEMHKNTTADWYTPDGGYTWAQDLYENATLAQKWAAWYNSYVEAYDSRWMGAGSNNNTNRQFINFSSFSGGRKPYINSDVLNPALNTWLTAVESGRDPNGNDLGGRKLRTGVGVVPMDFPTQDNIDLLIRANFGWTHRLAETSAGLAFVESILKSVEAQEP
jgi:1-phosphatidylinositol phosphodiesterase